MTNLLILSIHFVGLLFASALALANSDGQLIEPKPGSYLHENGGQYHVQPPQKIRPGQVKPKRVRPIEKKPEQPSATQPASQGPAVAPAVKKEDALAPGAESLPPDQPASQEVVIQLAAMSNYEAAESLRRNFLARYRNVLGTLTLEIENSTTPSGPLYRVRSGPLESTKARTLCDRFKGEGQDCIVVQQKNL